MGMIRFNIEALLEQRGKSRYWLAKQSGMSHQNVTKMVRNQAKGVRLETIEIFCQVLECTPNDLFTIDWEESEKKE